MPDPPRRSGFRQPSIQRIGDGPFFAVVDTPRRSSGAVGAAVVVAGLVFGLVLLPRTDQVGIYVPHDASPYVAKPRLGDAFRPNYFGPESDTLALLKDLQETFPGFAQSGFPDFAKSGFADFATSALPNITELFNSVTGEDPEVTMAPSQPVPQQVLPVTSTADMHPLYTPSTGGGGGVAPTPQVAPVPNLPIPPLPKLDIPNLPIPPLPKLDIPNLPVIPQFAEIPKLPNIPQIPDIPKASVPGFPGPPTLNQQSTQQKSAQNSHAGSTGTSPTGSIGTSNGAGASQGVSTASDSGQEPKGAGDGPKGSGQGPKGSNQGPKGSGQGPKG